MSLRVFRLEIRENSCNQRPVKSQRRMLIRGMNAVQIMTIHAAKGLQFPLVFLPALDEIMPHEAHLSWLMRMESIFLWHTRMILSGERRFIIQDEKRKGIRRRKKVILRCGYQSSGFPLHACCSKKGKNHAGRLKYVTDNLDYLSSIKILKESDIDTLHYPSHLQRHHVRRRFSFGQNTLILLHTNLREMA